MQNLQDVQLAARELGSLLAGSSRTRMAGAVGIVLGTGLGFHMPQKEDMVIPFSALPAFPRSTVASHAGAFIHTHFGDRPVLIQNGRCHLYEGRSPAEVCMGVRVMACLGLKTLIVTNAAGALNPMFEPGQLMCMADMINFTGQSPLTGADFGDRFPDMSQPFSPALQKLAFACARERRLTLQRGVYIGVAGPQMETPAETRMYRQWGADAIGMSTVLEVIAARHLGLDVLGISCLTNKNLPDCMQPAPLGQVIATARACVPELELLIRSVIAKLDNE